MKLKQKETGRVFPVLRKTEGREFGNNMEYFHIQGSHVIAKKKESKNFPFDNWELMED